MQQNMFVVQVWDEQGYLLISRNFTSKLWAEAFIQQQEEDDDTVTCTVHEQLSLNI